MSNPEWREIEQENNSDEDSAYISSNTLQLNESNASTSTEIIQSQNNQNQITLGPESPLNQDLANQLLNLRINESNNAGDNLLQNNLSERDENIIHENQAIIQEPNMEQPRIPGIGPIHQAVKNLPYFDGNPKMLRQFITSLQHLSESYGVENDTWILTYIPNRLKGRALMAFGGNRMRQFTSIRRKN